MPTRTPGEEPEREETFAFDPSAQDDEYKRHGRWVTPVLAVIAVLGAALILWFGVWVVQAARAAGPAVAGAERGVRERWDEVNSRPGITDAWAGTREISGSASTAGSDDGPGTVTLDAPLQPTDVLVVHSAERFPEVRAYAADGTEAGLLGRFGGQELLGDRTLLHGLALEDVAELRVQDKGAWTVQVVPTEALPTWDAATSLWADGPAVVRLAGAEASEAAELELDGPGVTPAIRAYDARWQKVARWDGAHEPLTGFILPAGAAYLTVHGADAWVLTPAQPAQ